MLSSLQESCYKRDLPTIKNSDPDAWSYTMSALRDCLNHSLLGNKIRIMFLLKEAIGDRLGKQINKSEVEMFEILQYITPEIIARVILRSFTPGIG